jgi:predicted porin
MLFQTQKESTKRFMTIQYSLYLLTIFCAIPVAAFADAPSPSNDASTLSTLLNYDDLTFAGVTLYGTIDFGIAHQTHGSPLNDHYSAGLNYLITKNDNKALTSLAPNKSKLGLKGDIKIDNDWSVVFKLETGFDPVTGTLNNSLQSMADNNGIALKNQSANGDSARAGQIFQGAAYAGASSKQWGTLTLGRQNNFLSDGINKYDPTGASSSFSVIGNSGVAAGGGSSENAILDNSIRYEKKFDSNHVAMLYQFGNASGGTAYGFNLGSAFHVVQPQYGNLSLDAYYSHKNGAIAASPLNTVQTAKLPDNSLAGTVSDNTTIALMTKYTLNPIQLYASYERIRYTNPSHPLSAGITDIGGYELSIINNTAYTHAKVLGVFWTGAKYAITPKLDLTSAYYHYNQNSYKGNGCDDTSAGSCSGSLDAHSLSLDYKVSKRFDVYAGAMYSKVNHGLASGYLKTNTADPMIGMRYNF